MVQRAVALAVLVGLGTLIGLGARTEPDRFRAVAAHGLDERAVEFATLPCRKNLQARATGFVIDDELVVTVAHALYETRQFAVRDARGAWHEGEIRLLDLERDLAVVRVLGLRGRPAVFASGEIGEQLRLASGAASGISDGVIMRSVPVRVEVIGDRDLQTVRHGYEVGLAIDGGDSGAGLVNVDGELVGIVFAKSRNRPGISWATASSELVAVLDTTGVPDWACSAGTGLELALDAPQD